MKKFIFILLGLLMTSAANAETITVPTTWANGDTVTHTKLNNINSTFANVINGGLDNDNADTTNGYFFFKRVSALPSSGTQGAVYFLTTDNSINLDTGSTFVKTLASSGSAAQGAIIYYNGSDFVFLEAGTSGQCLKTQGVGVNPLWALPSDLLMASQAQGNILYFNGSNWVVLAVGTAGQVLKTGGAAANPSWVSSVGSVLNYGTSLSVSTAVKGTDLKIAYGNTDVTSTGTGVVVNLPFADATSYVVTVFPKGGFIQADYEAPSVTNNSGAQFTITNNGDSTRTMTWIAIGS